MLPERDARVNPGIRQRPRGNGHLFHFNIFCEMVGSKADGVNRNPQLLQLRDGLAIHPAGVIAAIRHQNNGAQGHGAGLGRDVLQAVANARGGVIRLQVLRVVDPDGVASEFVRPDLKFLLQFREQIVIQQVFRALQPLFAVVGDSHAARVIHQNRHDVLLRTQTGDTDGRLPEHEQHQRNKRRLSQPDQGGTGIGQDTAPLPDVPEKSARHHGENHEQEPERPGREKDQFAFGKYGWRIFEQQLEHV